MTFLPNGKPWTPEQKTFLATHYAEGGMAMLEQVLQRGREAIWQQAYRQRLIRPQFRGTVIHRGRGRDPLVVKLRAERQRLKWSIPFVAEKCGVAKSSIAGWECGHSQPSIKAVRDWAEVLGLEIGVTGISVINLPERKRMMAGK